MGAAMGFFCKGLQDKFEKAVVNKPSVFKPPKFYYKLENLKKILFSYDETRKVTPMPHILLVADETTIPFIILYMY